MPPSAAIFLIPLVISSMPLIMLIKSGFCRFFNMVMLNISLNTAKNTMYPPIKRRVEMLFCMASPIAEPRFDNLILLEFMETCDIICEVECFL